MDKYIDKYYFIENDILVEAEWPGPDGLGNGQKAPQTDEDCGWWARAGGLYAFNPTVVANKTYNYEMGNYKSMRKSMLESLRERRKKLRRLKEACRVAKEKAKERNLKVF